MLTYEYLLSACEGGVDPRVLNYVYYQGTQRVKNNALLLIQYGEFLEEMNEYAHAREVFCEAYNITPTDDLARSVIRVVLAAVCEVDEHRAGGPGAGERAAGHPDQCVRGVAET